MQLLKNIVKILAWLVFLVASIKFWGVVIGTLIFASVGFVWNIGLTVYREYKLAGFRQALRVFGIIFHTDLTLPFTVYGCYCSPKYGMDGATRGFEPIDELDSACKQHDVTMLGIVDRYNNRKISKADYVSLKNEGDWQLMKSFMVSKNSANGMYLLGQEIGFLARIVLRSLFK